ncbi:MAG: polyprenyl synthetase family protein, partial [Muribaculaceae bacterium]|nr:polyprenyl synthetase family protein [Muribaculaceae bacterium]
SEAMPAALGLEMFHNFTLLHDDVMDKSDMRRGRPTVHVKWDENTAILSGDTMLTLAEGLMMRVADDKLRCVMEIFNRMSLEVYEGQAYDMAYEERESVSVDEYIEMVRLKTGALLGACAEIGAVIGGASDASAACMREYGEMLGIAFQIEDDWLDTYGTAEIFGKPIGGDINNAKKTYLLTYGLGVGGADSEALRTAVKLPAGDLRVRTVTRIYDKMGLSQQCRDAIARYSSKALEAVKRSGLSEAAVEPFKAMLDKLTGRKS